MGEITLMKTTKVQTNICWTALTVDGAMCHTGGGASTLLGPLFHLHIRHTTFVSFLILFSDKLEIHFNKNSIYFNKRAGWVHYTN